MSALAAPNVGFLLRHPAHFIALGFGAGLSPVAPGTFGTLLAIPLAALLQAYLPDALFGAAIVVLALVGVWAAQVTGRNLGVPDHGVDRLGRGRGVSGRAVFRRRRGCRVHCGGVRRLSLLRHRQAAADPAARPRFKNGVGVMADDLLAAGYTLARARDTAPPRRVAMQQRTAVGFRHGLDLVRIEESGLNVLQTQRQLFFDGWLLRLSPGRGEARPQREPAFRFVAAARRQARLLRERVRAACAAAALSHHALEPAVGSRSGACRPRLRSVRRDAGAGRRRSIARRNCPTTPTMSWSRRRIRSRSSTRWATFAARRRCSGRRIANVSMNSPLGKRHAVVRGGGSRRLHRASGRRRLSRRHLRRGHGGGCATPRIRDAGVRVAPVLGMAARRARRLSAGERRQRARHRVVPEVRLRDRVHAITTAAVRGVRVSELAEGECAASCPRSRERLGQRVAAWTRQWTVATAESCTGGLIAGAITDVAGSSALVRPGLRHLFERGQDRDARRQRGNARGAWRRERGDGARDGDWERSRNSAPMIAVAVTGIAGPAGGTADKARWARLPRVGAARRAGRGPLRAFPGRPGRRAGGHGQRGRWKA